MRRAREHVIPLFAFPPGVRRIICTTDKTDKTSPSNRVMVLSRGRLRGEERNPGCKFRQAAFSQPCRFGASAHPRPCLPLGNELPIGLLGLASDCPFPDRATPHPACDAGSNAEVLQRDPSAGGPFLSGRASPGRRSLITSSPLPKWQARRSCLPQRPGSLTYRGAPSHAPAMAAPAAPKIAPTAHSRARCDAPPRSGRIPCRSRRRSTISLPATGRSRSATDASRKGSACLTTAPPRRRSA